MLAGMDLPALIDTHCHLYMARLDGVGGDAATAVDVDELWSHARSAGVVQAVVPAIDVASSRVVTELVALRSGLFAAVGIHPNATAEITDADHAAIAAQAARPKVVAIGETGLDCYRDRASLAAQQASLARHAELALARDLPLILHVRQAFELAKEALAPFARRGLRAVMHCFDGGPDDLQPFVDWGFFISFSGIVTYPKRDDLRAAARAVPRELLLVETDAPFLTPVPKRGHPNEPAFVVHTAQALATARAEPLESLAAATTANARRLFRLPAPD